MDGRFASLANKNFVFMLFVVINFSAGFLVLSVFADKIREYFFSALRIKKAVEGIVRISNDAIYNIAKNL